MLAALLAVLVHFKSVRVVLLVLLRTIVSLLAFCASQCNFYSHFGTSYKSESLPREYKGDF
jgi:hypothetical protein